MLRKVADGGPTRRADVTARKLQDAWNDVLEQQQIAGYVYGPSSTVHVYFETDPKRVRAASSRLDLRTSDAARLKGMPGELILEYQRQLRYRGVDIMSSTGGVVSAAHTDDDVKEATIVFAETVSALREQGLLLAIE